MKKRILYVIDGLEFGGGERVFAQIIKGLPKERFESFLASANNVALQASANVEKNHFFPIDFSNRYNPIHLLRLHKMIRDQQIDIVHGQGARAEFYARLAAGMAGKRYVSTVAMPVEGYDVGFAKKQLYRLLDGFSERFVYRFLVVSSVLEKDLLQRHGIPFERVLKIYNGIETEFYKPDVGHDERRRIRREYFIGNATMWIGAVGRLVWQKGFEYFIHAFPEILREAPDARFVLVGDGPLRPGLEALSAELGVKGRILFAGYRSDVRDILAALDIVVIPSILEGFPMITLEAMAMEKPVVATAIDGIMEQITDGREGLLVDPANPSALAGAINRLIRDHRYAVELGVNARERVVRDFTVQKMIAETLKVYEAL